MNAQYNYISNNAYQGRNQAELQAYKEQNNFKSDAWLTFLQAREKGLMIKKGSKGIGIFNGYKIMRTKNAKGEIDEESRPMGWSRVFNLDQTKKFEKKEK